MAFDARVWNGTKPIVASAFGSRSIGAFALITPGVELWTDINAKKDAHDEPLGGIVTEITQSVYSDGEIVRSFRCYDYTCRKFRVIAEADIDRETITACDPGRVVRAVRRMVADIAKSKRSLLTGDEARVIKDAYTLTKTLMSGER